jgi:hypothetical protein
MGISGTDLLEVPTVSFWLNFLGISPQIMAKNMGQYLHFRVLNFPLIRNAVLVNEVDIFHQSYRGPISQLVTNLISSWLYPFATSTAPPK